MENEGQIKREDIISNEALEWGNEYAKTVKKVIRLNKKFIKSTKKIKKILKKL
ncbi:hypothetical protein [Flavobacterium piscisymbiosum]|uniref:Uncharacterized protein n=1 Tax=Flavobacterium piscisymbiosum TaxID=2893753 RepID=A0ABS8MN86_9FLAO|nr:hypothetical protein [Flavobacterium sp. F-30]MCC9066337.1 hypothetical protein [Flavobacterium sp. F-30]